jgi:CheY-like chemotaxis protein
MRFESTPPPFHILLVDDAIGDVHLAKMAIAESRFRCQVTVAENGNEAMTMLRRHSKAGTAATVPDLVLLDLNMPMMNGREVLAAMKADPALAAIPVVVLTTSDVERDIVSSYQLGAAGYITKPVNVEQLFKAIHGIEEYWFDIVRRPSSGE